ncbi:acyltransferase domain-containing protein [Micromonospora matsumotoense]
MASEETGRPIALLLPGQGAQHPGMAVELYGREAVFSAVMDEFFALMGRPGQRLRADWLADRPGATIDDATTAQPLLFAVGYALGRALRAAGRHPVALLGHSVGELAAAALADVVDLPGGAAVMLARSAVMATAPSGGLLAVGATPAELAPYLGADDDPGSVVIGARNAPRQTVLAGPEPRLSAVERELLAAGWSSRRVPARQPFHSPAVADQARAFSAVFETLPLRCPTVPIWSTRTGRVVDREQAGTPEFWAGQLAAPVLFWPALDALLAEGDYTLVEAGPGQGLSMLARRHPAVRAGRSAVVPLLPRGASGSWATWCAALRQLGSAPPGATRRAGAPSPS